MTIDKTAWATAASTTTFVLLWSSGAIFSKLGLEHASAFAFLILRFGLALTVLSMLAWQRHRWLPAPATRWQVAGAGVLLLGSYSICYLLALDHGVTPGVLATVLGVQPILTLLILERRFPVRRLLGLGLALGGLILVVYRSIGLAGTSALGLGFALAALACVTIGAMLQKRIRQAPMEVLPLQYAASLALCLLFLPSQPFAFEYSLAFLVPLLWMGLVISVVAQLLFYQLIQAGNLVNVTSLFYLVPGVTAAMDLVFLGNRMPLLSLVGLGAIVLGLVLVFRNGPARV